MHDGILWFFFSCKEGSEWHTRIKAKLQYTADTVGWYLPKMALHSMVPYFFEVAFLRSGWTLCSRDAHLVVVCKLEWSVTRVFWVIVSISWHARMKLTVNEPIYNGRANFPTNSRYAPNMEIVVCETANQFECSNQCWVCMVWMINVHIGIQAPICGYQNCYTSQVLIFGWHQKVRQSLCTIMWAKSILNHIDTRASLPRNKGSYIVFRHKWYRQ